MTETDDNMMTANIMMTDDMMTTAETTTDAMRTAETTTGAKSTDVKMIEIAKMAMATTGNMAKAMETAADADETQRESAH